MTAAGAPSTPSTLGEVLRRVGVIAAFTVGEEHEDVVQSCVDALLLKLDQLPVDRFAEFRLSESAAGALRGVFFRHRTGGGARLQDAPLDTAVLRELLHGAARDWAVRAVADDWGVGVAAPATVVQQREQFVRALQVRAWQYAFPYARPKGRMHIRMSACADMSAFPLTARAP